MFKKQPSEAVRLHPDNPRYFLFRGKPTVLITATEHYGAVTNAAFDYDAYLDMLGSYGFNLTRLVVTMREMESDFKGLIGYQNTLCPRPQHYAGPWARSAVPGCNDGGNRLDLDVWNPDFFIRLKDFCSKASERGIIVEITFFNQYYNDKADSPWVLCPLNPANNCSGEGAAGYNRYTTCENKQVLARQEALVRKVVHETGSFDNIYYEICNEPPYPEADAPCPMPDDHPHVLGEKAISQWQNHLAEVIANEEAIYGHSHMIAVGDPHESINFEKFSMFNYHYRQWAENGLKNHYKHNKVLAFDETLTGIVSWNREMAFDERRREAWEFFMRGFAVYDYLDFTIATDDPLGEGNAEFPGGRRFDGTMMRVYLKYLKEFMQRIDFVHMQPDGSLIISDPEPAMAWTLGNRGREYAVYIYGSSMKHLTVQLPEGVYRAEWHNPVTGCVDKVQEGIEGGNSITLVLPLYQTDIALRLSRRGYPLCAY